MLSRDDLSQGRSRRLHGHFRRAYFDLLCDRTGREGEIHFAVLIHLQPQVLLLGCLESLRLHSNGVKRDRQQGDKVMSRVVSFRLARHTCTLRGDFHRRPGNYRSSLVSNSAGKIAVCLTVQEWANTKSKRTEKNYDQRSLDQHRYPPRALPVVWNSELTWFERGYAWPRPF